MTKRPPRAPPPPNPPAHIHVTTADGERGDYRLEREDRLVDVVFGNADMLHSVLLRRNGTQRATAT